MRRRWRRIGKILPLMIIVVAGLLGACGSGATEDPYSGGEGSATDEQGGATEDPYSGGEGSATDDQGSTSGGEGGHRGDGAEKYGWGLPGGPDTPDDTWEDNIYLPLAAGNCAGAQEQLGLPGKGGLWRQLKSPRGVLLYQAAVHFCAGERQAGQQRFDQAAAYGWQGVDWVVAVSHYGDDAVRYRYDCEVYKAIRSVLEQRARDSISCPGGDGPTWPEGEPADYTLPRDDPRTPEDETKTPEPTEPPTDEPTEPTDEPTEPPPDEPTEPQTEPPTEPPTDG